MPRAILCVLDSVGVGGAPDAARFGDTGSNTVGNIAAACDAGAGDRRGLRSGPLTLPHMAALGLGSALEAASGYRAASLSFNGAITGAWGHASEISSGKDTSTGHWEIAGVPVRFDWTFFPETVPCFPESLIAEISGKASIDGILGNRHASGTQIIAELGEDHIATGKPIFYTSADSVIQIAAHEIHFGLQRLYDLCEIVRGLTLDLNIARVIARPFTGIDSASFTRTANRRDYSVAPPAPTILDRATEAGRHVISVGKIGDIFAHRGTGENRKAPDNDAMFDTLLGAVSDTRDGGLIFANFVDFDTAFGHRRDVPGYAAALEAFDQRLPELYDAIRPGDLVILTADHGCDPTWKGSDHTREQVPILAFGDGVHPGYLGARPTFADIGATVSDHLGLEMSPDGESFLSALFGKHSQQHQAGNA